MLNNSFTLFNISLPNKDVKNSALVFAGCNAYIRDMDDRESMVYSEFEEQSFAYLNSNHYGSHSMEIEFCFENNLAKPYHWFYASCFSIRTDNGLKIKLNGSISDKCLSKINQNNQMVIGVGVYFRDEEEYQLARSSTIIAIEGFIALDKYHNTFGISCKLEKQNDSWHILLTNTYQMNKNDDIRGKVH